jgi:hypothetical protein
MEDKVKPLNMLGLLALAALMAMAFVGAGTAMAESTALCSEDLGEGEGEICPEESIITHVHETTGAGAPAILKTNVITVKCDVLFLGELSGHFTYTNCNGGCEVKEVSSSASIELLRLGHELADVGYEVEWNVQCGLFIDCTYSGEGLEGHALGPLLASTKNGQIRIEEQAVKKVSGSFCPKTAELSILTSPLSATYIEAEAGEEADEHMVCIFVGTNRGHYLKATPGKTTECEGTPHGGLVGSYELAVALTAEPNKMVCALVGANNGLWLARRWWPFRAKCKNLDKNQANEVLRVGEYELGTTS